MYFVQILCCLRRRFCSSEARPSQYGSEEAEVCGGVGWAILDLELEIDLFGVEVMVSDVKRTRDVSMSVVWGLCHVCRHLLHAATLTLGSAGVVGN